MGLVLEYIGVVLVLFVCFLVFWSNKRREQNSAAKQQNPNVWRNQRRNISNVTLANTVEIPGRKVLKVKGVAHANVVRARIWGRDIIAMIQYIVSGEVSSYATMLSEARDEALFRVARQAKEAGANGVLNIRFSTSEMGRFIEVTASGTAVVLAEEAESIEVEFTTS